MAMKRGGGRTALAATAGALLVVGGAVRGLDGCYSVVLDDGLVDTGPPVMTDVKLPDASDAFVGPGPTCDESPGAVPAPNCFPPPGSSGTSLSCVKSSSGTCSLGDPSTCGATSCLPLTTNVAPIYDFRMAALTVIAPSTLSSSFIQNDIVTKGVTLNAPQCGYGPASDGGPTGAFNWLLQVDKKAGTLKTGGGGPVSDPYASGYCFVKGTFSGNDVNPLTLPITFTGNAFSTTGPAPQVLNVPIFLSATMLATPVILPIRGAVLKDVGISPDGNCIGDLNPEWPSAAGSMCDNPLPPSCPKWFTNGALAGYMTLADANQVPVPVLGKTATLCGVLVESVGLGNACTASDLNMGDYSSPDGTPNDSVWLSATFAANAVKIHESTTAPCGE
jgi:hypothetical protein